MKDELNGFDRTVSAIYDAALAENGWEIALKEIAHFVGGYRNAVLEVLDLKDQKSEEFHLFNYVGYNGEWLYGSQEIIDAWVQHDPWGPKAAARSIQGVVLGSELSSPEEIQSSFFWNEIFKPAGIGAPDLAAALVDLDGCTGVLAIYGDEKQPNFSTDEKRRLALLYPHISRSFTMQAGFVSLKETVSTIGKELDFLNYGVICLGENGRVGFMNSHAASLIGMDSIVSLRNGKPYCKTEHENDQFQTAINLALGVKKNFATKFTPSIGIASRLFLYGENGNAPICVDVSPVNRNNHAHALFESIRSPSVIISFSGIPLAMDSKFRVLVDHYGLSPREASIAVGLAQGHSLKTQAINSGKSLETIRSQLKSAFEKMHVHSQSDLVRLILALK